VALQHSQASPARNGWAARTFLEVPGRNLAVQPTALRLAIANPFLCIPQRQGLQNWHADILATYLKYSGDYPHGQKTPRKTCNQEWLRSTEHPCVDLTGFCRVCGLQNCHAITPCTSKSYTTNSVGGIICRSITRLRLLYPVMTVVVTGRPIYSSIVNPQSLIGIDAAPC